MAALRQRVARLRAVLAKRHRLRACPEQYKLYWDGPDGQICRDGEVTPLSPAAWAQIEAQGQVVRLRWSVDEWDDTMLR